MAKAQNKTSGKSAQTKPSASKAKASKTKSSPKKTPKKVVEEDEEEDDEEEEVKPKRRFASGKVAECTECGHEYHEKKFQAHYNSKPHQDFLEKKNKSY